MQAAPVVAPMIEPAAVKLLDRSVAAYEKLDSIALKFSTTQTRNGKAQADMASSGTLIIQGETKARLEWNGVAKSLFVANEDLMHVQRDAKTYYETRDAEEDFIYTIVSLLNEPLSYLMTSDNTLAPASGFGWKSVEVLPDKTFDCVQLRQRFAPTTYRIYFDKTTHLVRRVETQRGAARATATAAPDSSVLTLTPVKIAMTPAMFVYKPLAGAKKLTGADEEKYYDKTLVVGAKPFDFSGQTLDGKAISLEDYRGKVVLLDFWATWCEPCVEDLPVIEASYDKYRAQGFEVIAISADSDEKALRDFVAKHGLSWPQMLDSHEKNGIREIYGVRAFPTSFLIDKDGNIAAVDPRGEELEPAIQAALAK